MNLASHSYMQCLHKECKEFLEGARKAKEVSE